MKEALYWEKLGDTRLQCHLCPHHCRIADGKTGICRVRLNKGGTLYSRIYGKITSAAMDPIEKKPLYHFYPGSEILSLGTKGCSFKCSYCQNYEISQGDPVLSDLPPAEAVRLALASNSMGIAYTYNEPLIWFEYVLDTSKLAREKGLKNVLVTNGFINREPLTELLPHIDALNIDIKSIKEDFYRKLCKGKLAPVLEAAKLASKHAHVEITNLIIPGYNDTDEELEELAQWIAEDLGKETPTHLSAYFPRYLLRAQATPAELLYQAEDIFKKHLRFVYIGNVLSEKGSDTLCPSCGGLLIERRGYRARSSGLEGTRCAQCRARTNIVN